jgi:putative ABC transport system permease protein
MPRPAAPSSFLLALFVGAFTLTLTTAVGAGVTDYVTKQVDSLGADDVFVVTRTAAATTDGPTKYDPETSSASTGTTAPGLPGSTGSDPLTQGDLDELAAFDGILSVDPIQLAAVDYVQYDGGGKYELTINPTSSITKSDLVAGDQLNQSSSTGQLMLPSDFVEPLGFADAEAAVGSTVTLGITDVLGEQSTVEATIVGVSQTSLLSSGAGANPALVNDLVDVQSAGIDTGDPRYAIAVARFDTSLTTDEVASAGWTPSRTSAHI